MPASAEIKTVKILEEIDAPKITIIEAMINAQQFLEHLGYKGGDIHDDLKLAISRLEHKFPAAAKEEL
jgi:hypothetical protein